MIKLNFELGIVETITLPGKSSKFPGRISLDNYDPEFLQIKNVGWYRQETNIPELRIVVLPLKKGNTVAIGHVQPDEFNPLFETITFQIIIA